MRTPYSFRSWLLPLAVALALTTQVASAAVPSAGTRIGDYRTAQSGPFTSVSTWEVFVAGPSGTAADGSFVPATAIPSNADGTITFRSPHTVTLATAATLDEVFIEYGSTLEHSGTANLSITRAAATPYNFIVQGTYRELSTSGRLIEAPNAGLLIDETGIWRHSANGGTIPTALWASSALLQFDGITTATSLASTSRLGQTFGRITWNCPDQLSTFALGPLSTEATTAFLVAAGDVQVVSTGSGMLQLASPTRANPLFLGSGYEQLGGQVTVNATVGGPRTVNVTNDFTLSGGTFVVTSATTAGATGALTVSGSVNILGGTLDITRTARAGSVSVTGGVGLAAGSRLRSTGTGTATFNFAQGPSRLFSNLGTVDGPILFNVIGGATVDFGTYALFGTGTFTLSDGGVAQIGSPDGITAIGAADAALGNIRVGTVSSQQRTYSSLAYYIYSGTQNQQTGSGLPLEVGTISGSFSAGGLGVSSASATNTVTLTRPLLLHGELMLEMGRLVSTPARLLTLSTSAFLNTPFSGSDDSYVQGTLARQMDGSQDLYEFPIGNNGDYRPVAMRLSNPAGSATYQITANRAPAPNSGSLAGEGDQRVEELLGDAYWQIERPVGTTVGVVRIPYNPSITPDLSLLTIAGYNPSTARWENLGLVARNQTENYVEALFPPQYTLASLARAGQDPLPVELTRFAAVRRGSAVELTWATASERNSAWFVVERSTNGSDFGDVARVAAAGNSSAPVSYAATDTKALTATSYYRLRQIDRDGSSVHSDVVVVRGANGPAVPMQLYPNPAVDALTVQLPVSGPGTTVRLTNALGQVVLSHTPDATASQCALNISTLPRGAYMVTVATPGKPSVSQRLIKTAQ